jgi:glycosyltransferase involved in cell wall biosynthesis
MSQTTSSGNCVAPRAVMHPAAGLAAGVEAVSRLNVLSVLEATRLTGVARNALEYARLAREAIGGVHVAVAFALIRRYLQYSSHIDALRANVAATGLPVEVLIERHRYDSQVVDDLRRLVHARRPHIIETHHVKSHCLVALSGLWRHYTWVAFHHGYTQTDAKVRAYNQVDRWSLRHATHVVTTNQPFADLLAARGIPRSRLSVLHNGVRDLPLVPVGVVALRNQMGLDEDERVIVSVGRLSHEKGQADLIRAFSALRDRARLVIVGDGPDRPALERLTRTLALDRSVIFAGLTSNVAPYYAMADLFVLPSLSEGSPNALLEAMACSLPIVATRVGGVPEIASDGTTALLVPPRQPLALAGAITRLLDDHGLSAQLGAAARRRVLADYTPERRVAALSKLYAALAGITHDTDSVCDGPAESAKLRVG